MTLLAFHGDFDRLQAALTVALGGIASGFEVSVYFAFWAVLALKQKRSFHRKSLLHRLLTLLLPAGPTATSRLNFCGLGPRLFSFLMRRHGIETPSQLLTTAHQAGVRFIVCPLSMDLMGISAEELLPGTEIGGAACFVNDAATSQIHLVF